MVYKRAKPAGRRGGTVVVMTGSGEDGTRRGGAWAYGDGHGHGEGRVGRGVERDAHETCGAMRVVDEEAGQGQASDMSGSGLSGHDLCKVNIHETVRTW